MEGNKVVYCHFSFRRPRGEGYGIFSCALYNDYDGTEPVIKRVCMEELWKDHQHITAIQAYRFALDSIYKWQAHLLKVWGSRGITGYGQSEFSWMDIKSEEGQF